MSTTTINLPVGSTGATATLQVRIEEVAVLAELPRLRVADPYLHARQRHADPR